jgi:FMN phosphatase YigB (HAD superfamily)
VIGVAFSLAGTLGSENGLYGAAIERLVSDLYAERSEAPDGRLIRAIVQTLPASIRRPDGGGLDLLCRLFPHDKAEASLAARFRFIARDLVERHFQPHGDAVELLRALRELNIPVAFLSDGWSAIEHRKAELLDFSGPLIVTEQLECCPDGRSLTAFAAVAGALQLPSDRIWFVGRDPRRDIVPAHAAGFQTVWLNRSGRAYPSGLPRPNHIIGRLERLLPIIGGEYMRAVMQLTSLIEPPARRTGS